MNDLKSLYLLRAFGYEYLSLELANEASFNSLAKLSKAVYECRLCQAKKCSMQTKAASIMFLAHNSEQKSKNLASLELILQDLKLDFELCFVLKCELGIKNAKEDLCKPYLFEELDLKKPKLLVCLGDKAAAVFGIKGALNGQLFSYKKSTILQAASLDELKNKAIKEAFLKDLLKLGL